jgi:hypothetical protein
MFAAGMLFSGEKVPLFMQKHPQSWGMSSENCSPPSPALLLSTVLIYDEHWKKWRTEDFLDTNGGSWPVKIP